MKYHLRDFFKSPWPIPITILSLLIYVTALHVWINVVLPNPFIMPDGASYLRPALNAFHGKPFDLNAALGYGYSVFLAACLKLTGSLRGVAWIQHLLALGTGLLTGWIARTFAKTSWLATGLVFLFVAGSPRAVFYAHSILTENLFVFVQMLLIGAVMLAIDRRSKEWAFVAGLLLAVVLNIRPMGRAWLYALVILAVTHVSSQMYRRLVAWGATGFLIVALLSGACNYRSRGFWGFERLGNWYLAGNLFRYIDVNRLSDPVWRDFLRPYFAPELATQREELNWVWHDPAGPIRQLRNHPILGTNPEASYRRMIFLALRQSPGTIIIATTHEALTFIVKGALSPKEISKEQGALESLRLFLEATKDYPADRTRLLGVAPENIPEYMNRISALRTYPFEPGPWVFRLSWWTRQWMGVASWLAWGAALFLIWKKRAGAGVWIIVLGMGFQVLLVAAGGTYVSRYSAPLEPLFALLLAFASTKLMRSEKTP